MTAAKITPLSVGREYAAENPSATGVITVYLTSSRGRGRWGETCNMDYVLVQDGKASLSRSKKVDGQERRNGVCGICGRMDLAHTRLYCYWHREDGFYWGLYCDECRADPSREFVFRLVSPDDYKNSKVIPPPKPLAQVKQ